MQFCLVLTPVLIIIICLSQLIMTGTAYLRHNIPYELFYRVHILFLVVYTLTAAHTADAAQRSGEKERYQSYKWFVTTLLYYFCDILVMRFNHRFTTRIKSFVSVEGHEGSKMVILRIKRPTLFNFQPGQYAFLRSKYIDYAWHPFSIASEPETQILLFYIGKCGSYYMLFLCVLSQELTLNTSSYRGV